MSYSHLYLKCGFPKAPLANGIGRYVCQLQRITIKFCKHSGSSRGIRDFIETELLDFAKNNPGIVIYIKPRRHRGPVIKAEYLNGESKWLSCRNFSKDDMIKWINLRKTQSGVPEVRLTRLWHTDNPSIQGPWSPHVNRDPSLNLAEFPNVQLSQPVNLPKTATEKLLEIFKESQEQKAKTI